MRSPGSSSTNRRSWLAATCLLCSLLAACSSDIGGSDEDPDNTWSSGAGAGSAAGGEDGSSQGAGAASAGSGDSSGSGDPGDPSGSGNGSGPSSGVGGGVPNMPVVCGPIGEGMATVTVNGTTRTFNVQLPANTSQVALLFLWHGWMQMPWEFSSTVVYDPPAGQWKPFDPNAFPMPLMIVTPWDTKIIPPWGLDWDIVDGDADFPFFEAMLQCIGEQFNVDHSRIYSFGFSAGAVFTNMLSAKYPNLFAATISESGAWFNDSAQWSDVLVPIIEWKWPDFDPADRGNVLLTHGGPNDFATIISLESANEKALPFLYQKGRTVLECEHGFGHTLDPDLTQGMYYQYMWAHQLGGPPLSGTPPGFPVWPNNVIGSTFCTFHPAP
jgi:predicted esterase